MKLLLVLFMLLSSASALANIAPGWFKHKDTITKASIAAEVDAGMLASFAAMESSFRHEVKHSSTSAKGLFQFTVPTWKATARQYGKQYGITERTSRSDPMANALMAAELLKENQRYLTKYLKREPTILDIYLAHYISPRRVVELNQFSGSAKIAELYPNIVKGNESDFLTEGGYSRTVAQFKNRIMDKLMRASIVYGNMAIANTKRYVKHWAGIEAYIALDNPVCVPKRTSPVFVADTTAMDKALLESFVLDIYNGVIDEVPEESRTGEIPSCTDRRIA